MDERRRVAQLLIATLGEERTKLIADAVKRLGDTPEAQVVLEVAVMAASHIRPDLAKTELQQMAVDRPEDRAEIQGVIDMAPKPARRSWRSRTGRVR